MASTNTNNPDCPNCNKSGLAILPVRYAVVPNAVSATLPEPLGHKVKDVKLAHHRYALRTLREGFVYLFYEKHARGSHIKWEAYSVAANGTLWKQLSIAAINKVSAEPACSRNGHNIPASVIAIERPEKCGKVWMAFSEHAWSVDTFKRFQADAAARNRRMQVFEPAKWVTAGGYRHAVTANEASLQHVLEYKNRSAYAAISPDGVVPQISKENGEFVTSVLQKETTRYPLHGRHEQAKELATLMNKVGENTAGKHHAPAVVALWDAVGITHELAGFAHEVVGWIEKLHRERELEVGAMHAIEGLKKSLLQRELAKNKQHDEMVRKYRRELGRPVMTRADAGNLSDPQRSQLLEVCDVIDQWESKSADYEVYQRPLMSANKLPEPERSLEIERVRTRADQFVAKRAEERRQRTAEAPGSSWENYKDNIDTELYGKFLGQYQALLSAADVILEARTSDLLAWLESPFLIDALTEFDDANLHDGQAFADQVAELIYGMNGSQKGGAKLDAWVREDKLSESNLLWRAVALNQNAAMLDLKAVLAEAREHQASRTLAVTLDWVGYTAKSLKGFADTYKKFNTARNANVAAMAAGGSKAFGAQIRPVNMRGIDKLIVTAGDRFFKAFSAPGLADYASEKIIQHIFAIRAFVDPKDSAELIIVQAKNEGLARQQQLERLRRARPFLAGDTPSIRTAQSEALGKAWDEFKTKNAGAASALKDARLAVLVMLIEGVNFQKLMADCATKNDAKSWLGLAASGLTITSTLFDVASVPAKAAGAETWSYQKIKLFGGFLGSAASAIGAVLDLRDAAKFYRKDDWPLFAMHSFKGTLGFANAALIIAATFTYSAPVIARLTGNTVFVSATKIISARAAAVIGFRIFFMSVGAWLTVATLTVQTLVWVFADDALEEWCSLCAFGRTRTSDDAYRTTKAQASELEKALVAVGI